ncbi:hypothetical protein [Paenibacillus sp. NFR01]|uniref:hypothetical protein n=1 Tax=Paenibacillus sp. NFR01 TaxID=1566279 RepID=UPI001113517D|nr:hypothetical protein [Paenibacillus sp. NFR01]
MLYVVFGPTGQEWIVWRRLQVLRQLADQQRLTDVDNSFAILHMPDESSATSPVAGSDADTHTKCDLV